MLIKIEAKDWADDYIEHYNNLQFCANSIRAKTDYIEVLGKVPIRDKPWFTVQIIKCS